MRLFLTENRYKKALVIQNKNFIQMQNYAKVVREHLQYDQLDDNL